MTAPDAEMKACPFCGCNRLTVKTDDPGMTQTWPKTWVNCNLCDATAELQRWNTRATPPAQAGEVLDESDLREAAGYTGTEVPRTYSLMAEHREKSGRSRFDSVGSPKQAQAGRPEFWDESDLKWAMSEGAFVSGHAQHIRALQAYAETLEAKLRTESAMSSMEADANDLKLSAQAPVSGDWRCKACEDAGHRHCSDPVNCGGMKAPETQDGWLTRSDLLWWRNWFLQRKEAKGELFAFERVALNVLDMALAALQPRSEWRPIESAPKDGTRVLLRTANIIEPWIGSWFEAAQRWNGAIAQPELWQPLPEAPKE